MRGEAAGINASHLPLAAAADGRKTTMTTQPRQLALKGKQAERGAIENVIQRFGISVESKPRQNWGSALPRSMKNKTVRL